MKKLMIVMLLQAAALCGAGKKSAMPWHSWSMRQYGSNYVTYKYDDKGHKVGQEYALAQQVASNGQSSAPRVPSASQLNTKFNERLCRIWGLR